MRRKLFALLAVALFLGSGLRAQTVIRLEPESEGRYTMNASVNGVGVKTYFSESSWFASMSTTTYLFLYENGYIDPVDVKGMTVVKMPDGSTVKAASLVIKNLKIGNNVIVRDLPTFVINKQNVPLLVGNSAFDCFGDVVVKDDNLYIYDGIEREEAIVPTSPSIPVRDSLMLAAQAHIDAEEYVAATACFEALREIEPLGMYPEYQYIMLLNMQHRNKEVISHCEKWLEDYEFKTSYLDYWIYDAMGDAYARTGDHPNAISRYESAVAAYYKMFSITEKDLMKSGRKDETLGYTLYDLGKQYSGNGNLMKAQHCFFVSAKCGNAAAIELCEKLNIKR